MPVAPGREFLVARNAKHASEEVRCHSSSQLRRLPTVSLLQDLNQPLSPGLFHVRRRMSGGPPMRPAGVVVDNTLRDSNALHAYFNRVAVLDGAVATVDFGFHAARRGKKQEG
jgi:hypothetical protein